MDGLLRCSRYAFGPNRLHYCGPDANGELLAHIQAGVSNPWLESLLKDFRTMYPYLRFIAEVNNISDAFDGRVVEAYWIGNNLLENIEKKKFYRHLLEAHQIKKKVGSKSFRFITDKITQGAAPHHSFHVLDIWKRTGHIEREHTLESMDACRVSWGEIKDIQGPIVTLETEPLIYKDGKLSLDQPIIKKVSRSLESPFDIEQLKIGDLVSLHWGVICETITSMQALSLKKYTLRHLVLANQTI